MRATIGILDRRFAVWAAVWTAASFVAFGLVSAIIANPIFGRQIPPEPFAIVVWLASAPLMGLILATYMVPAAATMPGAAPLTVASMPPADEPRTTALGAIAGLGAFLAIGCPVCNKVALVLLGTSGALEVYAPLQPVIGAVSLALLAATLGWRMRAWSRGAACATRGA